MIIMYASNFLSKEQNILGQEHIKKMLPITRELEYSQTWDFR